ncbi:MAG: hypothetical protein ACI915_000529 [Gammaproteobacteria bacterium]|jgi:hypothetical protein
MSNDPNRRARKPRDIADRVAEFLAQGDLDGVVSMFHPQCSICFPLDEPPKIGHAAVREIFAPLCEIRPKRISKILGELINGDTALLQAEWRFEDSSGNIIAAGQSTEVAKKWVCETWGYYIDCPLGAPPPSSA